MILTKSNFCEISDSDELKYYINHINFRLIFRSPNDANNIYVQIQFSTLTKYSDYLTIINKR